MVDIARPTQASKGAVISALGVVMIFTWGSTYYLMAVLAAPIAAGVSEDKSQKIFSVISKPSCSMTR